MFSYPYTPAELDHLQDLCLGSWMASPQDRDPGYFRYMAELYDEPLPKGCMPPLMSEEDPFEMTSADMLERADAMECDFIGGEQL